MKRVWILSGLVAMGTILMTAAQMAQPAAPQQPAQPQPAQQQNLEIQKVKDNLYVISGGGGNTAAFVGANGVVLVDTKNPGFGQAILDKVKGVTDKPITTIINTHTHPDHVSNNGFFPASVEIVVHENTKTNMANMDALKSTPHAMPDKTYKDKLTVGRGAEQIDLYYFGRAHTNGDTFVVFPALRAMHAGDVFGTKGTPFMDGRNGGSGVEYPKTIARVTKEIRNIDTVIPGHSPATDWATLVEFGEFVQALVSNVQESAKAGKTIEEAVAAVKVPEKFSGYTVVNQRLQTNVELIYKELGK